MTNDFVSFSARVRWRRDCAMEYADWNGWMRVFSGYDREG
jgi:hypothetical protein